MTERCTTCGAGPNDLHDDFHHMAVEAGAYDHWSGASTLEKCIVSREVDERLKRDLAKRNYLNIHQRRKKRR